MWTLSWLKDLHWSVFLHLFSSIVSVLCTRLLTKIMTLPPTLLFTLEGGFMFKQWKERYIVLTMEGSLMVCRDAESPPDQVVTLQTNCESIVEGRTILDLPKLPPGGRRDCCFALIMPQNKFLLLLTDNPDDCKWVQPPISVTHTSPLPHSLSVTTCTQ